jgi:indolepyruvate ferredoxin oxidoreductase beta subunit
MSGVPERPLGILVAALGGEGGGVLADWLVSAATAAGYPVQSTSIPGVAQRTGATTYYLELYPARRDALGGREPLLALTPSPGNVDVMVASELIEAGRALQNGYVTPDRTTLIASTHRVYAMAEKSAMGDGRFDATRVRRAAEALARRVVLFDMERLTRQSGTVISAVLFGAIAGSGALPLPRDLCERAIRESGKGAEASLRGFAAGFAAAAGAATPAADAAVAAVVPAAARVRRDFPSATHDVLERGVARLADYQDAAYAELYLDRLASVLEAERGTGAGAFPLTVETGRQLALWMSYEDVVRVADLKTRAERFDRVRREVGAKGHEPVAVTEFLKPGLDEICSLLPPALAGRILAFAERRGWRDRLNVGLHVRTTTVTGYLMLRALARLKAWRRRSSRFADEQRLIERWLAAICRAAGEDIALALEISACARLIKGYGETHRRGSGNFRRILDALVDGEGGRLAPQARAAAVRRAREAALADPEGRSLADALAAAVGAPPAVPANAPGAARSESRLAQAGR